MLNRQGWLFLGIMAVLGVSVYVLTHWTDCKHTETREVETLGAGRLVHGLRKHEYKVCVER
jgi:hypothetical protein